MSRSAGAHHWDADSYHRVADPQFAWGRRLLERLVLRGDETVIDAGCGSGRLTRLVLERLPIGRVIAVDASPQMIESARGYLEPDFTGRIDYRLTDLLDLELDAVADVVFSTATFHWINDQSRLFWNLARALRPGGRLLAQMGGQGNLERLRGRSDRIAAEPAFRPYFEGWTGPWVYPDAPTTRRRLERSGFSQIELELFPEPTTFPDAESFRQFITTVNFRLHLQRIPDQQLRHEFIERLVDAAAGDDPPYTLDYWRLNMSAIKR